MRHGHYDTQAATHACDICCVRVRQCQPRCLGTWATNTSLNFGNHEHIDRNATIDADAHADTNANTNAITNAKAFNDTRTDTGTDANSDTHACNANPDANADSDADDTTSADAQTATLFTYKPYKQIYIYRISPSYM